MITFRGHFGGKKKNLRVPPNPVLGLQIQGEAVITTRAKFKTAILKKFLHVWPLTYCVC